MQNIYAARLTDILPESLRHDEKIKIAAQSLDKQIEQLTADIKQVLHLPRLDELNGRILDYLAEQWHCDFYEPLWLNDDTKRELIRTSIDWHRRKGTISAVEEIANDIFTEAIVEEAKDYGGEPYHFRLFIHGFKREVTDIRDFLRALFIAKNVRSHLDKIVADLSDKNPIKLYAGQILSKIGTENYLLDKPTDIAAQIYVGNALFNSGEKIISLDKPAEIHRNLYLGQYLIRGGQLTIKANLDDLREYNFIESPIADLLIADIGITRAGEIKIPVETFEQKLRSKLFAGNVINFNGSKTICAAKPTDLTQKLFIGQGLCRYGEVTIQPDLTRYFKANIQSAVGQVLFKSGRIIIGSENKPSIPPDKRIYGKTLNADLSVGQSLFKYGNVSIKITPPELERLLNVSAGQILIKRGELVIGSEDLEFVSMPLGDFLRLIFAAPSGRREITLLDPRDDLTKGEIKQVGNFAVSEQLLLNSKGDTVTELQRALLIRKAERKIF